MPEMEAMVRRTRVPPELNPNVAWMLWETADRFGGRPAVVERERTASFEELRGRAAAYGRELCACGVRPGDRVAVFLERGIEAAAAFFGVLATGAVPVMLNEALRTRQVDHVLERSGAAALVTTAGMLARLPRAPERDVRVVDGAGIVPGRDFEPVSRQGADVAQIIYTSGSTGRPKGVTLSHANLWAGMRAVVAYLGIDERDRIASLLPFSFTYGLNQLFCAVGTGAALIVERSPVASRVVDTLRERRVTVLPAVPPLWLQLLQVDAFTAEPLPALRVMTNAGGRLPTAAVRRLRAAHPEAALFLMYGMTEVIRATYLPPDAVDRRPDSIGRAIPGAEVHVLREDGRTPCAPGEVGELVYRGPTVALGYWGDPEGTARVFRPNPLRPPGAPDTERVVYSGDLVRRDAEGYLYFVGRRDRMIKTLGYRVSPDEIVEVLHASGELADVAVTTEPDEERGVRIVAHVVLAADGALDRLRAFCRAELPRYMQPARFEVHDALPRTTSGKHDVAALTAGEAAAAASGRSA